MTQKDVLDYLELNSNPLRLRDFKKFLKPFNLKVSYTKNSEYKLLNEQGKPVFFFPCSHKHKEVEPRYLHKFKLFLRNI